MCGPEGVEKIQGFFNFHKDWISIKSIFLTPWYIMENLQSPPYSFGSLTPLQTSFNNSLGSTSIAKAIKYISFTLNCVFALFASSLNLTGYV